jgi:hypothetical protein
LTANQELLEWYYHRKTPTTKENKMSKTHVTAAFTKADPTAVRVWAKENGIEVGTRGRFSRELLADFRKANPKAKARWDKTTVIRSWTVAQGIETGARGRFTAEVLADFYAAHTPSGQPKGYRSKKTAAAA